jgi:hypothetical protein
MARKLSAMPFLPVQRTKYSFSVPWFFPESSNDETDVYMSEMKLEAALANNASISPALGIVDLNKENAYTLTEADGTIRHITIAGSAH